MSDYLPPVEEQQWLLDALADLVKRRGVGPLVSRPILLPTPECFPDPWTADARGARRLCQRLLLYAGLEALRAEVVTFTNPTEAETGIGTLGGYTIKHKSEGAVAWFAGIEDGRCLFGVDTNQLSESAAVVGTMCHEIAHAYRAYHHLMHSDRDEEELLTDVTTIFLGFGVLTANSSDLHRSGGGFDGARVTYSVRHLQAGYLLPEAMCFLLAAQAAVRRLDDHELHLLHEALEVNQASYFKAGYKSVTEKPDELTHRLGIPAPAEWPAAPSLAQLTRPLADLDQDAVIEAPSAESAPRKSRPIHEGLLIFNVPVKRQNVSFPALMAGLLAVYAWSERHYGYGAICTLLTALLAIGDRHARRHPRWHCSEPECAALIPDDAEVCPQCGGQVAGTIRAADERLAAREAILGEPEVIEHEDHPDRSSESLGIKDSDEANVHSPES